MKLKEIIIRKTNIQLQNHIVTDESIESVAN